MLNTIFDTIFTTTNESTSIAQFLLCIAVSLLLGFFFAIVYRYKNHATQSFLITLALLPATVCAIILMVNGNVGAGVAVAGAFSLPTFFANIKKNTISFHYIFLLSECEHRIDAATGFFHNLLIQRNFFSAISKQTVIYITKCGQFHVVADTVLGQRIEFLIRALIL